MERIDEVFSAIRETEQLMKIVPDHNERAKYCRRMIGLMKEYRSLVCEMIENEFNF